MSGSVNKVILVGNLGRDPEIRFMQSGDKVVNLAIATSERWTDRTSGEERSKLVVRVGRRPGRRGHHQSVDGAGVPDPWRRPDSAHR